MSTQVLIPKGEEKITVELTKKEAMALMGVRFNYNHDLVIKARKKLEEKLEEQK